MNNKLFNLRCIAYFLLIYFLNSYNLFDNSVFENRASYIQYSVKDFEENVPIENRLLNFENFNNNSGVDYYLVPNIFHYVNLNQSEIRFGQFLSILSVWVNHKPDRIILHCNHCNYSGKYWDTLNKIPKLKSIISTRYTYDYNEKIFRNRLGWVQHKSDVLRLLAIMNLGGIYLDNDMIVINSLDKYRKFEIAVSWESDNHGIGNQIFIANKNARFLRAIYDQYRDRYKPECWYCNGGHVPQEILLKHRYLVHQNKLDLGTQMLVNNLYYRKDWNEWDKMDAIHLLLNHRSYLDKESPIKEFDEINIRNYSFTFGTIARSIFQKSHVFDY
jgi:hypothetical protein